MQTVDWRHLVRLVIRLFLVGIFALLLFLALEYVDQLLFMNEIMSPFIFFCYRFFSGLICVFLLMSISSISGFGARYGLFCFVLYSVYFMSSSILLVYGGDSPVYRVLYWFSLPLGGGVGGIFFVCASCFKKHIKKNG